MMFTNPVPPTRFKRPPRPENRRHWCPKCCSSTCILTKYQTDIYEIHYDHAGVWKYQAHLKDEDRYTKYQGDFLWSVKLKAYLGERKLYRKAVKLEKKKSKLIGLARQIKVKPTPIPDEEYDGWSDY